ncbi:MAG TPA: XrtA system polysaccharide deacetylase [bacterium]|nr:XrtA system polysaccharide deacetylase [bacterium]
MKNVLSVDVEDWFQVSNFEGVVPRDSWDSQPSRVERNTRRLLDLFDGAGARGTFFVLGWIAERYPALVREIRNRGHDLASHGYGHELVYRLNPQSFATDLLRASSAIESAGGAAPKGYRAPSFSIDRRSFWAFDVLAQQGYAYDSSVFPVRHPRYGVPQFPRTPIRVRTSAGHLLAEFPLTTARLFGRNVGAAGGGYLRILPLAVLERAFAAMNETGEPACLYVHPWEIDPEQPRLRVKGLGRFTHYTNLDRTEGRLKHLLQRFEFAPMEECLRHSPGMAAEPQNVGRW